MSAPRPLTLIWRRATLDYVLEGYFIKDVLLGALGRPVRVLAIEDKTPVPFLDDVLVVSLGTEAAPYLRAARARGHRNIGLFHMGDESGAQDRSFYALADYVLRHYWFEHVFATPDPSSLGVLWVPNGYRTGVGPVAPETRLGMAARQVMGFFAGALEGRMLADERAAMMRAVSGAKLPFTIIGTTGFGQGMGPVSYAGWLGNARLALVPAGNSHETIRLYDALETGAIPVMVRSPFVAAKDALDHPPFLLLDGWDQLPTAYAAYADAAAPAVIAALDEKQRACLDWWSSFQEAQQQKLRVLIDRSYARAGERS